MINNLFSGNVVIQLATPEMWYGELYPEELAWLRNVVYKRLTEFTAGRLCAREALKQLKIEHFPLLVGSNREPLWPAGIIGSISHCSDVCLVVASNHDSIIGLGVDVENADPLETDTKELICTQTEKLWIDDNSTPKNIDWAKTIFSAKESIYKCLFPLTRIFLDFKDVQITIDNMNNEFSVEVFSFEVAEFIKNYRLSGRFLQNSNYIFTGVELIQIE